MSDPLVLLVVNVLVAMPIYTLLHELGHAAAAYCFGARMLMVGIGSPSDSSTKLKLSKALTISLAPLSLFVGWFRVQDLPTSRLKRILIYGAGPLTSLLVGFSLYTVSRVSEQGGFLGSVFETGFQMCLIQGVLTLLPLTYPSGLGFYAGVFSDGKRIILELEGAHAAALPKGSSIATLEGDSGR